MVFDLFSRFRIKTGWELQNYFASGVNVARVVNFLMTSVEAKAGAEVAVVPLAQLD